MQNESNTPTIAVIGGGFCGTMIVANLVKKAQQPLRIFLIERSSQLGKGIAYGTYDPEHALNVHAIKMGAFASSPEHFLRWAEENESLWRDTNPSFKHLKLTNHSFLPRQVYGLYLESVLKSAQDEASKKNIEVVIHQREAVDLEKFNDGMKIFFRDGDSLTAEATILSVGLPSSKLLDPTLHHAVQYTHNIWVSESQPFPLLDLVSRLPAHTKIAIVGSGLTMIDAIISLLNRGYEGSIIVISKHGLLPEAHKDIIKVYPAFLDIQNPPRTALELLKAIRKEVIQGYEKGYDWRSIIDALRPLTPSIWGQLPLKEKRKILRFLLTVWNRHRHRTAPECLAKVEKLSAKSKLTLLAGKVQYIDQNSNHQLLIKYRTKDKVRELSVDYLINCSGAEMDLNKNDNPLIQNLLKKGFILPDSLHLGIQTDICGEVKGKAKGNLFAVGQILFGERFETVAVPELRTQCDQLTNHLLSLLSRSLQR